MKWSLPHSCCPYSIGNLYLQVLNTSLTAVFRHVLMLALVFSALTCQMVRAKDAGCLYTGYYYLVCCMCRHFKRILCQSAHILTWTYFVLSSMQIPPKDLISALWINTQNLLLSVYITYSKFVYLCIRKWKSTLYVCVHAFSCWCVCHWLYVCVWVCKGISHWFPLI